MPLLSPENFTKGFAGGTKGSVSTLGDLGSDALEMVLSAINVPFELLGRPAAGVSEAVGESREGGDFGEVLGGAWRGLSGGRPRFPSVGEKIFPESKGASVITNLLADPLMFLPVARIARGGVTLAKGTRLGKLAAEGLKGAKVSLRASQGFQRSARLFLPLRSQLSFFGGHEGKAIALKAGRAIESQGLETARRERSLIQEIERLKLGGKENLPRREIAALHLEAGGARKGFSSGDAAVDELANFMKGEFDDISNLVQRTALFPDFKPLKDYFPQMLRSELVEALERGNLAELQRLATSLGVPVNVIQGFQRSPSAAVSNLAKMLKVSVDEAEDIWRFNTGRPMRAGHIELKRAQMIPKELLERDPLKVLPRYMNQVNRRVSYALEFGKDFEGLDKLLEGAKKRGLLEEIASDVRQVIRDPISPEGTVLSKDFARKLMGGMVVTKMGPTSTIANLSQNVNTIVVDGGANFLRGIFKAQDPARRAEAVVSYHTSLRDTLEHLIGSPEKPLFGVKGLGWLTPEKYLRLTGFTPAEKVNRILSATSGVATAERLAKKAVSKGRLFPTKQLLRRGVTKEEFRFFKTFGEFSEKGRELIGLKAANRTQHVTNYLEIPLGWRSPEMRLFTQYKSFVYQQSRFIHREIMKPAFQWFNSNGKEGSLTPLLRASVAFGVGGQAVAGLRSLLRGEKRKFDSSHPLSQILRDASYVGAFGMANDIVDSALRGKLGDYFWGPTASEAFDVASDLTNFLKDPEIPSLKEAAGEVYQRVGRGPLPFLRKAFE